MVSQGDLEKIIDMYKSYTIEDLKNEMKCQKHPKSGFCFGDIWHNEKIDLLFADLDEDNKLIKMIASVILQCQKDSVEGDKIRMEKYYKDNNKEFNPQLYDFRWSTSKWIDRILNLNKGDLRLLNSICKAKSNSTFNKRLKRFFSKQIESRYGLLFNEHKIMIFDELFKLYNTKGDA